MVGQTAEHGENRAPDARLGDSTVAPSRAIRTEHGGYAVDTGVVTLDTALLDATLADVTRLAGLEQLTADYPLRERGWQLLVCARADSGRTAEALRAVRDARRVLAEAGLTIGSELVRLEADLFLDDGEPTVEALRHNLVEPITSFIGRSDLLDEIADEVAERRLVTLHGVGGVGKTRVAASSLDGTSRQTARHSLSTSR